MLKKPPKLQHTIKSKAKGRIKMRPASIAMAELLTLVFLSSLAEEAAAKAFEEKSSTIKAHHVKAVSKKVLKKARG
ncbi:centromere protein W [Nothobranchius furzeri]|uniref:Centromere protein W-like n=1 Tax=Nothobranchius furzeri TaxID=105023 RepID=A0A9D3C4K1_NOTFU|nr:centromere protein W-like [Nothobranchius furzeri]